MRRECGRAHVRVKHDGRRDPLLRRQREHRHHPPFHFALDPRRRPDRAAVVRRTGSRRPLLLDRPARCEAGRALSRPYRPGDRRQCRPRPAGHEIRRRCHDDATRASQDLAACHPRVCPLKASAYPASLAIIVSQRIVWMCFRCRALDRLICQRLIAMRTQEVAKRQLRCDLRRGILIEVYVEHAPAVALQHTVPPPLDPERATPQISASRSPPAAPQAPQGTVPPASDPRQASLRFRVSLSIRCDEHKRGCRQPPPPIARPLRPPSPPRPDHAARAIPASYPLCVQRAHPPWKKS